ncbi:MAG TPA: hypothetical protein VMT85_04790 [Thermoanaerobaculia bacterium]|nr:hypothetical protein [Thermoanaerobaculia bacterium]
MSVGRRPPQESASGGRERRSLEQILGAMDRQVASPAFTARAVTASIRPPRRRPLVIALRRWRMRLLVTGALAAAGLAGFWIAPHLDPSGRGGLEHSAGDVRSSALEPEREQHPEAEALRAQLRDLERELLELERLAAEREPLIAIEGGHADYLIDLRDFLPTTRSQGAVPARYRPAGRGGAPHGR